MVSQKTADLITQAGKGHWLTPREDLVHAKGKGALQCYWCLPNTSTSSAFSSQTDFSNLDEDGHLFKAARTKAKCLQRLVSWNVDLFKGMLEKIVATRDNGLGCLITETDPFTSSTPIDEVKETISLPKNANASSLMETHQDVKLSEVVQQQLEDYITAIANMYNVSLPCGSLYFVVAPIQSFSQFYSAFPGQSLPRL